MKRRRCIAFAAAGLLLTQGLSPMAAADAAIGLAVLLDRDRGHCLLCHRVQQIDAPFQGDIGPDLSNVGERLSASELRERVADPTRLNPDTAMPAYHRTAGLQQVMQRYKGRPVLTAQELDDLVDYLLSLRGARK